MRKLGFVLTAAVALLAPVAVMSPASAAAPFAGTPAAAAALPTLTVGSPTGPAVNPGDILNASLTSGTVLSMTTSPGGGVGLFCMQSSWQASSLANPPVGGPAANRLTSLTIAACTDNNPGVASVAGVGVTNLPDILQVIGTGTFPVQILPSGAPLQIVATLVLSTGGTAVCTYRSNPPVNGTTGLGAVPWSFTNQPFALVAGSPVPACGTPPTDFFTASYSPVIDLTQLGMAVYVN